MSVDVFAVADSYNHHKQNLILDLINDSVIAHADAVKLFVSIKQFASGRSGIGR